MFTIETSIPFIQVCYGSRVRYFVIKFCLCHFLGMRNSTCSIRFTYETSGRLRVLIEDNGRTRTVWSVETVSSSWQRAYVELPQNASVRVSILLNILCFFTFRLFISWYKYYSNNCLHYRAFFR